MNVRRPFLYLFLSLLLLSGIASTASAQFWVGTGYDGVSENYYLVVIDSSLISLDSLESLRRTSSTVHEAEVYARSQVGKTLAWDQTTSLTSLAWQHRTELTLTSDRLRSTRGRIRYNLDHKRLYDLDSTEGLASYSIQTLQAEGELRGESWETRVRGTGDYVVYPDGSGLLYDYRQVRGEWRLKHMQDDFEGESITLHAVRREVPDSSRFSYDEFGVTGTVPWWIGLVRFGSSWRVTDRRYDAGGLTDYSHFRGEVYWRDDAWPARWPGRVVVEGYNYYAPNSYLADYVRVEAEQRRQVALNPMWTMYVEPGVERYASDFAEDYWEPRLGVGGEYLSLGGIMATADLTLARRQYDATSDALFGSDYWRWTIDLLVDGPVWGKVSTSVLVTQDWEWHESSADDITMSLVSVGVRYRL